MKPKRVLQPEVEIPCLIAKLIETERRLVELTAGEVDAVAGHDGRAYVLQRAQEHLRHIENAKQDAILNALPAHIALLDAQGEIISVNEKWRQFGRSGGMPSQHQSEGVNYLAICDGTDIPDNNDGQAAAAGIRGVLNGTTPSFSMEYASPSRLQERWFLMIVTPLTDDRQHGVVVMHVNITERKRAQRELEALAQKTERRERMLLKMLSALSDLTYIFDRKGCFLFANQPLLDLWGLKLEEVVGRDCFDLGYPADLAARFRDEVQQVFATGKSLGGETPYRDPAGRDGYYEYIFSPAFGADGSVEFVAGTTRDITERKHADLALRESNEKFTQLTDNITDVFWVRSADMQVVDYISPAFERIWGRPVASLYANPQEWPLYIVPEDSARVQGAFATMRESGVALDMEYRIVRPDGNVRWVHARAFPIREASGKVIRQAGIVTDITERKKVEQALQVSEHRFKAIFEQAAVGVALIDAGTGRFVQVNQRYADILGRSRPELEELTFAAVTQVHDVGVDLEMMQRLRAGTLRESSREKRYIRKDGSEVWVSLTVSVIWGAGEEPSFCIKVVRDITERKQLEAQLRQAHKMEAIGTLAGGIAHDFNNILAAIGGYTELARMKLTDQPDVRGHLDSVIQTVKRAADLVRQILSFSRERPLERRMITLQPVVTESIKLLRATLPATIKLDLEMAENAPMVLADETQVLQVLINLVTNAQQALGDRPGCVLVKLENCVVNEAHRVAQSDLHPGRYAHLSVRDTGGGMAPETLRRIFEPFFTTKGPGEGTGLGLAVVHGIMESHDGLITVDSQLGVGTEFQLYFPAHVIEAARPPRGTHEPPVQWQRVLLVDDEKMLIEILRMALGELGYAADAVTNAAEALQLVRAAPTRFALVITDQAMPGMTGLQLAAGLGPIRPDLPIILMTGHSLTITLERVKAAGIAQLLLKPITLNSLRAAVHAALSHQPLATHVSNPPY